MTTLRRVAICKPLRTPGGKFLGSLAPLEAGALGAVIIKALVERSGIGPRRVDDVVFRIKGEVRCKDADGNAEAFVLPAGKQG